jgi:hypothetical protein
MRRILIVAAMGALALGGCASNPGAVADGFEPLFDGKTLAGWVQRGGKSEYRVENGCLVGATRPNEPNSFLCTQREFDDFVLELEFKVDPGLNSGVQIRSESRPEYQGGRVHGYQVDIDPSSRAWTGGIYDEGRRGWLASLEGKPEAQHAFRQGEWNAMRVEARGDLIRTWINGVPTAELRDSMTSRGFIALQVHGVGAQTQELTVRWRGIKLRPG